MSRTVRTVAVSESEPAGTECMMTRGPLVRAAAISAADERAALSEVDSVITQHAPTLNPYLLRKQGRNYVTLDHSQNSVCYTKEAKRPETMATSTVETTQNRTAAPAKGGTTPKAPPPVEHENTWDYIRSIPKSDWDENVFMYLFRTQPITDRKRTGNNLNIMKYTQPIDVDHVVKTYGSGGYRILLERYDPATRKTKAERDFYFDILNFDYPPRVPYGEWVDDERNKQWLWAKPALEAEHQKLLQKNGTLPAPGTPGTDSISQATGMFRAAVDAVRQLRPDETPEHQETLATTVIRLMEANHKEAIAASNPAVLFPLMKELLNSLAPKQDTTLVDI